ncbi:gliding motility-associated C-terminal domain-containing protein [Pontimicrobium sp. SW4]|uniref:Gliding motility-associated C-terminal domain-containing protein n=1 Tax=Pontimicrobium sp. SW4 TaxID=3153519 RepID=A0AAU7BQY7_9FLAO
MMRNFTLIIFFLFSLTYTISAQIVISTPSLSFSQACANESFNTYYVTFSFSPESELNTTNQFIIELSDDTGSFSNPTTVYTSTQGAITTSPATLGFSLPNTTASETYKVRIKSTAPAATSIGSVAFPAYYKIQDEPFSINNLISTAVFCSGSSYLLSIDNPGNESNNSPLQYPSLTFNWYKETSPTTSVFVASGETLSVTEPGVYFVKTNYGSCTSDSFSNRVTVSEASSGQTTSSISSSLGNPYCSTQGPTTLSAINGNSYKWFKDGEEISGATDQMLVTNESGIYEVNIDLGDCTASASIELDNTGFTSSIDVSDINYIAEGETLMITVSTTADSPEYVWYLNNDIISGAINNSYEVSQIGNYKVIITQTVGCNASMEFNFVVSNPFPDVSNIPNLISPNGDNINDTWMIPQEFVSGTNTEVIIMDTYGKIVLKTTNYQNNWPQEELNFKNVNPVYYYVITTQNNNTRKGSITVVR